MNRVSVGETLSSSGALKSLAAVHNGLRTPIVVLAYHRVLPAILEENHPYDLGLISTTPEEFDWQMRVVRNEFDPIPLSDVGLYMAGRTKLPKRPVVVTFDDGYADNYHHAFPVLQRHGIPATVFVTAGHMSTDEPLWHDLGPNIVIRAREGSVPTLSGDVELRPGDSLAERRAVARKLLAYMKSVAHSDAQALVDRLRREHAMDLRPEDAQAVAMLSWEQIRTMVTAGIEIGSHTMTHAMLSRLDNDQLRYELIQSKTIIEQQLQKHCDTIAYPVGRSYAINDAALAEVGLAGYRIGAAYDAGVNWARAIDLYALRRQSVERTTSRAYFRTMLSLPKWFQ